MKCPGCQQRMRCTNSYRVPGGRTQRMECLTKGCRKVVAAVTRTEIVAVDPGRGQGAAALAKKLRDTYDSED